MKSLHIFLKTYFYCVCGRMIRCWVNNCENKILTFFKVTEECKIVQKNVISESKLRHVRISTGKGTKKIMK